MQSVQIAASEVWISLIFFGILALFRDDIHKDRVTKNLLWACTIRLLSDAVSWGFDGFQGPIWHIITVLSNYLTFTFCEVVSVMFTMYLWKLVREKNHRPDIVLSIYWLAEAVYVITLIANVFTGWYYSFDSANYYCRGQYYYMTHIMTVISLAAIIWLLFRYWKKYKINHRVLGCMYLVLMAGATVYEFAEFGLTLQNYVQTFTGLSAFLITEIDIRKSLEQASESIRIANEENMERLKEIGALNSKLNLEHEKLQESSREQEAQINEIKELNKELESANKQAGLANKAKTSFLFNMSHDIRTPMNAIIGFTELLSKNLDDREKTEDYLSKIKDSNAFLLSLINNILDMARIESGVMLLNESCLSIRTFEDNVCSIFKDSMRENGIDFSYNLDVEHKYVMCDATKVKELHINLLSNAMKYTAKGGRVSFDIEELPSEREGYVFMRTVITDDGEGMSEEFVKGIFDEYTRERRTVDSRVEGSGLGMAIVKSLVDLMEGTISIESELGKGTRVTVVIPYRIASDEDVKSITDIITVRSDHDFTGKRVLLTEDNELNAEIAKEILSEVGISVEWAEDGVQCLEMLDSAEAGYYDLILMDIQMPRLNGYDTTIKIRAMDDKKKAEIPILAMTANAFEEDRIEAEKAGMNGHLAKPINVNLMMKLMAENMLGYYSED